MTRAGRLRPVVQHTDDKEQEALRVLAKSQSRLGLERTRLDQLNQYKHEYARTYQHNRVFSALELQEFNRFLAQLDDTIGRQRGVIELRQREMEQCRQLWQATRIDSKMMHTVVENLEKKAFMENERKEQKSLDELSQLKKHSLSE